MKISRLRRSPHRFPYIARRLRVRARRWHTGTALPFRFRERKEEEAEHTGRKKPKFFLILTAVILTPASCGLAVAIFATKSPTSAAHADMTARQTQIPNPGPTAEATIGAVGDRAPETPSQRRKNTNRSCPTRRSKQLRPRYSSSRSGCRTASTVKAEVPVQGPPVETPKNRAGQTPSTREREPRSASGEDTSGRIQKTPTPAFVAVEKDPQIVKLEKPEFPSFVWKMGVEGQVVVRVLIDANGKPLDSQILKSTNPVFEQPVIDAVMKSQFNPAQMGQGPVAAWLTIPFKFKQPK